MKRMLASSGYTIVEVMIVLAVTGALLISVMGMISGQQRRTEFVTAVRESESRLQDVFNDVEAGFFPNTGAVACSVPDPSNSSPPTITALPPAATLREQGTNDECIFLGKAIQFYEVDGLASHYRIFTIAGKRQAGAAGAEKDVSNLNDANPTAYYKQSIGENNALEMGELSNSLEVSDILYMGTPVETRKGLAVLSAIGAGGTAAIGDKSATNTPPSYGGARLGRLDLTGTTNDPNMAVTAIEALDNNSLASAQRGAIICLRDGPGGRSGAITIGVQYDQATDTIISRGQRLTTEAYFDDQAVRLGCTA